MAVDVVLCGDRNILWGMAVAARSALENSSAKLNLHVISSGFTTSDQDMLRQSWAHDNCGTIQFTEIDTQKLSGFRSTAYLKSKLSYARYFLADLFPDIKRCIYIDTDVIVEKDLAVVAKMDMQGHGLAAALDVGTLINPVNEERRLRLGLRSERNYFNAGVLIIDQEYWVEHGISEKLVALSVEKYHDLHSQDQDALNIIFENKVLILDPSWNTSQYWQPDPIKDTIIHLLGTDKPWHALYRAKFAEAYYKDIIYATFYGYLDGTAYAGKRPGNMMGLVATFETLKKKTPTRDMILGKFKRTFIR